MSAASSSSSSFNPFPAIWEWVDFNRRFPEYTEAEIFVEGKRPVRRVVDTDINPALLDRLKSAALKIPIAELHRNGKGPFIAPCFDDLSALDKMTYVEMKAADSKFYAGINIDTSTPDRPALIRRKGRLPFEGRDSLIRMVKPYRITDLIQYVPLDNVKHGDVPLKREDLEEASVFWTAHKLDGFKRERLWYRYPREIEYLARKMLRISTQEKLAISKKNRWWITKILCDLTENPEQLRKVLKIMLTATAILGIGLLFFSIYSQTRVLPLCVPIIITAISIVPLTCLFFKRGA